MGAVCRGGDQPHVDFEQSSGPEWPKGMEPSELVAKLTTYLKTKRKILERHFSKVSRHKSSEMPPELVDIILHYTLDLELYHTEENNRRINIYLDCSIALGSKIIIDRCKYSNNIVQEVEEIIKSIFSAQITILKNWESQGGDLIWSSSEDESDTEPEPFCDMHDRGSTFEDLYVKGRRCILSEF